MQRLIVAQIKQDFGLQSSDPYALNVQYKSDGSGDAPWFDWGPYLWASGVNQSPGNLLFWCDSTTVGNTQCQLDGNNQGDFRNGDINHPLYWGDHTHPSYRGQGKVAGQIVKFLQGQLPSSQSYISDWVAPWRMR